MPNKKGEPEETQSRDKALAVKEVPFWKERFVIFVALAFLALDQLTKFMVVQRLPADPGREGSPHQREYFIYQGFKHDIRKAPTPEGRAESRKQMDEYMENVGVDFEIVVIEGFFNIIHRTNSGAAFSILSGRNNMLAFVSVIALGALIYFRHHFEFHKPLGRLSFGLLIGGILGNMIDRVFRGSVVDFVEIGINQSNGERLQWPAFNVADSAIVVGVVLLFVIAWREDRERGEEEEEQEADKDEEKPD